MRKSIILSILLLILINLTGNAQKKQKKQGFDFRSKHYYIGGNLGLMLGSVTIVDLSPELSMAVSEKVQVGVGALYTYYREKTPYSEYHYSIFGGRVFGRYFFLDQFYAHGEYERTYYKDPFYQNPTGSKYISGDGLNLGVGYIMGDYRYSYSYIALLYNALDSEVNFGINPFFRFGFVFVL